jgi:hypothetical protein
MYFKEIKLAGLIILLFTGISFHSIFAYGNGKKKAWDKIKLFFTPDEKYKNDYGTFCSPLLFYNGDSVKTKSDWQKRRVEILDRWHSFMGEWPPVLTGEKFEYIDSIRREDFMQYKVRFKWTPDEMTEGYLLIPDKKGKKPAIITVFYEPETAVAVGTNSKPYRDFAYQLTKKGFVTLSLGTSKTTKDKTFSIYYPDIERASVQPLSMLAYVAANAWQVLSKTEGVDSTRIGITGHSYGGKWAMFASCLYDKFACAVWSDPGIVFDDTKGSGVNYWEPWYLGYYPPPWNNKWRMTGMTEDARGLYPKLIKSGHDLHELHALMAPRPFLVSGGSSDPEDRWIPLNHAIAVNSFLGYENRVAMTNRTDHAPNQESNEVIFAFFECFLNQ